MTQLHRFAPDVLAFFPGDCAWARSKFEARGLMHLEMDGAHCPAPKEFVEQLALAVRFPGPEVSLSILGQELSNLDWLDAKRFGICIAQAELLFARGNDYMWQYLLELAWNIQKNVEEFDRPAISWLLEMDEGKAQRLQAFFESELGFVVPYLKPTPQGSSHSG